MPAEMKITRRYGCGGFGRFAYLFDTLANKYLVYAPDMEKALALYRKYHTYEPWSIRQVGDGE